MPVGHRGTFPPRCWHATKVALARSVSNGAMLIAVHRGYFKDERIEIELSDIDTASDALSLVAQGQIQIVGAGVSAGYFNAVDRGLPVTITISRVAFPAGHTRDSSHLLMPVA